MKHAVGKKVNEDLYVHLSALDDLEEAAHRLRIEQAIRALPSAESGLHPCVAKLNVRTNRLSLLAYVDFDEDPFPKLAVSWVFAQGEQAAPTYRSYLDSLNPPILHRKELLVPPTYPERGVWERITATAEALGLYDDTTTIGFKLNWERLIAAKGYRLAGEEFVPLANSESIDNSATAQFDGQVQRHLTALTRYNLSAPIQLLFRHGLLPQGTTLFDYGCGRGDDVATLTANGFAANGWDPHYAAKRPIVEADVVNIGFVVNVIEDPAERVEALHKAFKLAKRVLSVSVMLNANDQAGRSFGDGVLTSRSTFQKYFTQAEFKDYVEQVLQREAFMAGPGVAFVFADNDCEQRFHAGRFRCRGVAARLIATRTPRLRVGSEPKADAGALSGPKRKEVALLEAECLGPLWTTALDLGRWPEPDEVSNLGEIEAQLGGLSKAVRLLTRYRDQSLLAAAATTRTDDLRLYFAMQLFSRRPVYSQLEPRLRRDIKSFFGDYRSAQEAGRKLLEDAAEPAKLFDACAVAASTGLGWLDGQHSLQLHLSMVDRLPALLRAYVACGLILWDAVSEVQLVKIHIASGKLTLIELDDFDTCPTPPIRRRIKVNVRRLDYDLFDYGSGQHPKTLLYRKSRWLHEDYPGYAEQLAFDEALEATGILGVSDFGPQENVLLDCLESRRLAVSAMRLVRSARVPDLDQKCGEHFTYRSFIECGETQGRLRLKNLPLNPASYNALYDLATQILDPVVDYFGAIRLTYGFCSAELGRHITKRVAPKLDQHAACEVGPRKGAICDRLGAACDFFVEDENMYEVADWIIANLPFDRLYFYGAARPIHISYGPQNSRAAYQMAVTASGAVVPKRYVSVR